ncbi:hypothetical protein WN51_09724 [Melipona quadrifasciata]|uniref:Uncharacterized protein n=1 Tax=Melipona quadrifasciata TaxID=166423 RepID=A0A0N0U6C2_9HYME|nr:hypothetical protein WN51_09724 [Melipona quadrifasciata]
MQLAMCLFFRYKTNLVTICIVKCRPTRVKIFPMRNDHRLFNTIHSSMHIRTEVKNLKKKRNNFFRKNPDYSLAKIVLSIEKLIANKSLMKAMNQPATEIARI